MGDSGQDKPENKWTSIISRLFLVLLVISLLASSVMFVSWLNKPGNFPFKKVELVNRLENQESSELQIIAANALNGGFFSLDVDEFRAELLSQLPWVKSVSVRKVWPNKLLVEIAEYKPVVRWISAEDFLLQAAEGSLLKDAEGSLLKDAEGSISKDTVNYQLLSQEGIIFAPELTEAQKRKFNNMALLSGPKVSAKSVLKKCVEISKDLTKLDLAIKRCGMNKRRTWKLSLTQNVDVNLDIKLGKENVLQQLERFIQVFSGKLKQYLKSVEYVDLRYSNGFSIKWNVRHTLQDSLPKNGTNQSLIK